MSAIPVPTVNIAALYNNTTSGTDADPQVMDNAIIDLVATINTNASEQNNNTAATILPHADGSVITNKLADFAVTTVKIAPLAVTTAKIAAGAVGASQLDPTLLTDYGDIAVQAEFDRRGINPMKFGAIGNGIADDTVALQAALNAIPTTGGTVLVSSGTYMIDTFTSLIPKSNTTIILSQGAILKAITTSTAAVVSVIKLDRVDNVNIRGGTIQGERLTHIGITGEYGMGIDMRQATNIRIEGVTIKDCWGDGIYVGSYDDGVTKHNSVNLILIDVVIDNARRNGMSLIALTGGTFTRCVIKNTNGTSPQLGIDVEPNALTESVTDLKIFNCDFISNVGGGFAGGGNSLTNVNWLISGCDFFGNLYGAAFGGNVKHIQFIKNKIRSSTGTSTDAGPLLIGLATDILISVNEFIDNNRGLTTTNNCDTLTISNNHFYNNGGSNINIQGGTNILISQNNIYHHGSAGVRLTALSPFVIGSVSIKNNKILGGNSLNSSSVAACIWLENCTHVDVIGNTCLGDGTLNKFGINIRNSTAVSTFLMSNICYASGVTSGIANSGASTVNCGNVNNDGTFSTTPN